MRPAADMLRAPSEHHRHRIDRRMPWRRPRLDGADLRNGFMWRCELREANVFEPPPPSPTNLCDCSTNGVLHNPALTLARELRLDFDNVRIERSTTAPTSILQKRGPCPSTPHPATPIGWH